jgi:acyl-CoA synthetase (NDP forming)
MTVTVVPRGPASATQSLRRGLRPRSVAVVGASSDVGKWGHVLLRNLQRGGFAGPLYAVNPKVSEVLGVPSFAALAALPEVVDLAVVAVPAERVLGVIRDCATAGISAALVVSAGLAETGEAGRELEDEIVSVARAGGVRLFGPNSNGLQTPSAALRATLADMPLPAGGFGILSQSGNIAQALALETSARGFGIRHYISSGNEADTTCVDYLEYLGGDDETDVILAYVEGFRDGRRLLAVARDVSLRKPIVLLKAGESEAGARAAMSHTAVLSGSDAVVDAVCRQTGIVRVRSIEEAVDVGVAFAGQPLPRGARIGVLTAAGGYGVMFADACSRAGLDVANLDEVTLQRLDELLPDRWPRRNPVDKSGKVGPGTDLPILAALLSSPNIDAVVSLGVPIGVAAESMPQRLEAYRGFLLDARELAQRHGKPILSVPTWSLLKPDMAADMTEVSRHAGVASYPTLSGAAAALAALVRYARYCDDGKAAAR